MTEKTENPKADIRWAVNVLLEKIATKFEAWETMDLWRSDAASTVRSFKHDLSMVCVDDVTADFIVRTPAGYEFHIDKSELEADRESANRLLQRIIDRENDTN